MRSKHANLWEIAELEEMAAMKSKGVLEEIDEADMPSGAKAIKTMWVCGAKTDQHGYIIRLKARLVALGNWQRPGIDFGETFAPVAHMSSFRLVIALAAKLNLTVYGGDMNTAYLNASLEIRIALALVYVDDVLCATNNENFKSKLFEDLNAAYGLKDQGKLSEYLGIEVKQSGDEIFISQRKYARYVLAKCENIEKRREFGEALQKHERDGAFIVYYDETNYNINCKRSQGTLHLLSQVVPAHFNVSGSTTFDHVLGAAMTPISKHNFCSRALSKGLVNASAGFSSPSTLINFRDPWAPIGERTAVKFPPSKGANLQLQCAVSPEVGLVHYDKRRGSIKMEVNAGFVDSIYDAVEQHDMYKDHFVEKNTVVFLDNAPAHNQTENLVRGRCDLVLLRLGPYSPMCNLIEGTALKARRKAYLSLSHEEMMNVPYGPKTELRIQLLEKTAEDARPCMDLRLVNKMARHCALSVAAAIRQRAHGVRDLAVD
ncbi:unnamed protein product [Phytophthora fragariaefolia]|uniref:Unnamed protein product n=1 Tax=Phytophthora fragariaefolia TaxID=1490495 RepID=A0A9W6XQ95_9STRA|nr:unnamed protein product [Phytophthora fragariaefolia]